MTNSMSSMMTNILTGLGVQFPLLVVCFLGVMLALMQMQRLPRVSLLVAAGLGLLLLVAIIQPLLQPFIANILFRDMGRGMSAQTRSLVYSGIAFVFNLPRAIAIGLIAYAAFVERPLQATFAAVPAPKAWPGVAPSPTSSQPHSSQNAPGNVR